MDRVLVFPGAIPLDTDLLNTQRNAMIGLGYLAQTVLGQTYTAVSGLACTPTAPATMVVNVGPGAITSLTTIDATAFGSLNADTTDPLVKFGINKSSTSFTLTAPTTSGQSINYLIEAAFQETDNTPVTLPYYNSANPSQPYSGPNNSGTPQNTLRQQLVQLQLKAGAPANTGTQVTPTVDNGWVGLWVIQVNYGASSVTSGNITAYTNSPFITGLLSSHHGGVPGQAPKINLATETTGTLPAGVLPTYGGPGMMANMQAFTSSGTFTAPTGVTKVRVTCTGGGGGGGGNGGGGGGGSGGGAGGTAIGLYSVTPGSNYTVTVGAGGTPGGAAGGSGGNAGAGGSSSFSSFCSATGGGAGVGSSNAGNVPGGAGGTGTGGTINLIGGSGIDGIPNVASSAFSGLAGGGGASFWGGGGRGAANGTPTSIMGGEAPGSGAAGSYVGTAAGGTGATGFVLVEW